MSADRGKLTGRPRREGGCATDWGHISNPILLLDSDRESLMANAQALRDAGIPHVIEVSSTQAALDTLENTGVSLAVIEIMWSHTAGEDLLREIRRRFSHLPVVIVTACRCPETQERCLLLGAAGYLLKPIRVERLLAIVAWALEQVECA